MLTLNILNDILVAIDFIDMKDDSDAVLKLNIYVYIPSCCVIFLFCCIQKKQSASKCISFDCLTVFLRLGRAEVCFCDDWFDYYKLAGGFHCCLFLNISILQ